MAILEARKQRVQISQINNALRRSLQSDNRLNIWLAERFMNLAEQDKDVIYRQVMRICEALPAVSPMDALQLIYVASPFVGDGK